MAEQLNGLARHAALALTIEDESDLGLVELGSQALESFPGSVAVLSLSPGIAEGNATRLQAWSSRPRRREALPFIIAMRRAVPSIPSKRTPFWRALMQPDL